MKLLHESQIASSRLCDEARTLWGKSPSDVFVGDTLKVDEARDIGELLGTPGIDGDRIIVCSYDAALPRAIDTLLRSVEDSDTHLVFACNPPLPDTFRSRFVTATSVAPSIQSLYAEFGGLGRTRTIDDVVANHPEITESRIRGLYDSFFQSVGPVGEFLTAVQDGYREAALRASLSFEELEVELLHAELELQLAERSLTGVTLTGPSKDKILTASLFRDANIHLLPPAHTALVLNTLL